jgi:hypothetical protein
MKNARNNKQEITRKPCTEGEPVGSLLALKPCNKFSFKNKSIPQKL